MHTLVKDWLKRENLSSHCKHILYTKTRFSSQDRSHQLCNELLLVSAKGTTRRVQVFGKHIPTFIPLLKVRH